VWKGAYAISWILLGLSMINAGLGTQMGYTGWIAVFRGKEPTYPSFPSHGLYTICRHPVYFSMALVSCSGPVWNIDHVIISAVFISYCIAGPMIKDRRFRKKFGDAFVAYHNSVPFYPTPTSCFRALFRRR
jgi:uncharacterized membrane protein